MLKPVETKAIVDSGSKYNLFDEKTWQWLKIMNIKAENKQKGADIKFKSYGEHVLHVLGTFEATLAVGNRKLIAKFFVMKEKGKFLTGRETAHALGILKITSEIHAIDEARTEFSKIKGFLVEIPLKENAKSVAQPYRRVPVPLENIVDEKIHELQMQGIIEKVDGPSKWISPLSAVTRFNFCGVLSTRRKFFFSNSYFLSNVYSYIHIRCISQVNRKGDTTLKYL